MSLLIEIDRASLSLADLVLSADNDVNELGVTNYVEPAMQARIRYAPSSDYVHGDVALAVAYQQSLLRFDVITDQAATETESRALLAVLKTALRQRQFNVTVTVDDADPEVWACVAGSIAPAEGRTFADLRDHDPEWTVTIPCHPFATPGV